MTTTTSDGSTCKATKELEAAPFDNTGRYINPERLATATPIRANLAAVALDIPLFERPPTLFLGEGSMTAIGNGIIATLPSNTPLTWDRILGTEKGQTAQMREAFKQLGISCTNPEGNEVIPVLTPQEAIDLAKNSPKGAAK